MKKLLLHVVLIFSAIFYSNAQVIDIVGKGIHGDTSATIELSDLSNINHVDAFVTSKGLYATIPTDGVLFDNTDSQSSLWSTVDDYSSPSFDASVGYYSQTFNNLISKDINATITVKNYVHSFYVYIYRDKPSSQHISYANLKTAFVWHNGSNDPIIYNIPINAAPITRNITVKIPISELDTRDRMVDITIEAGASNSHHAVETTFNYGNSFFLGEYLLENVPGEVTNVKVSIYSPNNSDDQLDGDSFFVNGVVVDVDIVFDGCTLTQGYWKTHSTCKTNGNGKGKGPARDDTWYLIGHDYEGTTGENSIFMKYEDKDDEQTYCEVFDTKPGKGGKYYILAHQYIAAELNMLAGADPSAIAVAFSEATQLLENNTPDDVKGDKTLESKCVRLGGILADYNEGSIGPGHCDDDDEASIEPVKQQKIKTRVAVYPNPATTYGKIAYTPKQSGKTTIELYNMNGQKVGTLFNKTTKKETPVIVEYNTEQFKKGLYFAIIRNGSDVHKEKISIVK